VSQEEWSLFWEVIVSVVLSKNFVCTCVLFQTVSEIDSYFTVHCTEEQHVMSSHELHSALMLTVEFSKMYYTRETVPTLSLEQQIPVLEKLCGTRGGVIG
jgi:hypothetical protein